MLQHISANYITLSEKPPAFHLGDIINIIQQYHLRSLEDKDVYGVFSDHVCTCGCKTDTQEVIKTILSILDSRIHYMTEKPESQDIITATPAWFKGHTPSVHDVKPYAKAKNLPADYKNYVVCQFDVSSSKHQKEVDSMTVTKILKKFNNIINIGNKKIETTNMGDKTLKEKFDLIANAQLYIGLDSGLTHLALMTNTPVFVMHPLDWSAHKYYPKSKQIHFATKANEMFGQVKTWVDTMRNV